MSRRVWIPSVLAIVVGCAGSPSPSAEATPPSEKRQENVITAAELDDPLVSSQNLLEAVRRLRPGFLVSRGAVSIRNSNAGKVRVSVNGGVLSDIGTMSNYMPSSVAEVRYLSSIEAAQKFGNSANSGGVILVKLK